jgi:isoquinoline 1-oxidoreductase beta subunit
MHRVSRRSFLKAGAVAGAGLTIGFSAPLGSRGLGVFAGPAAPFTPNAWIRITPDNIVTIIVGRSEMGQGVLTALPMLIAEELEADWSLVRVESAPSSKAHGNPWWAKWFRGTPAIPAHGAQVTAGSSSVTGGWLPLRQAGAAAKTMLVEAAAREWGVPPESCVAENSTVVHRPTGRRFTYGELADKAAKLPAPADPKLKPPAEFRLIGRRIPRLETAVKIDGRAVYGIDVRAPQMLVAVVARCPVFGGTLKSFDATRAKAVPGVRHVVPIGSGLAVVADNFWAAKLGRDALEVTWDEGPHAALSSAGIQRMLAEAAGEPGPVALAKGETAAAFAGSAKVLEAAYETAYVAHTTLEPMNCTADVRADACEIWVGTQWQDGAQAVAAKITGLPIEAIRVHTTLLGGGFGRRFEQDFVAEAVEVSKAVGGPVKVIWTREDDMQHDFYRPATYHLLRAGLDGHGVPVAWLHRVTAQSIGARLFPPAIQGGFDAVTVDGATNLAYAIPNIRVECVTKETAVPVGIWRAPGHSWNTFAIECFLDEIAAAGGKDPYELRRALLAGAPRHRRVLELAAARAGWGRPLPPGQHRGIAVTDWGGTIVAEVAQVSVSPEGRVRVHRVVCAVDCGVAVHPDIVEAQIEGGVAYGLNAALRGEITIANGRVQQSNFHDYLMMRIDEMPEVEVHIVPSAEPPSGVGEPGTPPIAPAVANAIYAATGKRIRSLPISKHDLSRM